MENLVERVGILLYLGFSNWNYQQIHWSTSMTPQWWWWRKLKPQHSTPTGFIVLIMLVANTQPPISSHPPGRFESSALLTHTLCGWFGSGWDFQGFPKPFTVWSENSMWMGVDDMVHDDGDVQILSECITADSKLYWGMGCGGVQLSILPRHLREVLGEISANLNYFQRYPTRKSELWLCFKLYQKEGTNDKVYPCMLEHKVFQLGRLEGCLRSRIQMWLKLFRYTD